MKNPPSIVYHGTDAAFGRFDVNASLGAHFGTKKAAADRLKSTGRSQIEYVTYPFNGQWWVREQSWGCKPTLEHGPFDDEEAAESYRLCAPRIREPLAFEIEVHRPLELPDLGTWEFEGVFTHLMRERADEFAHYADDIWNAWNTSSERGWASLKGVIVGAGYDCIAYKNETEDPGSTSWIVMDPDKIHRAWQRDNTPPPPYRDRPRA